MPASAFTPASGDGVAPATDGAPRRGDDTQLSHDDVRLSHDDAKQSADGVQRFGSLRAMFHAGQIGPAVALDELLPNKRLFAVGALSDLRGEITILDGSAYLSYPVGADSSRTVAAVSRASACLLAAAEVAEWVAVRIEHDVTFDNLDSEIARLAASVGIDVSAAFPFIVEGTLRDLRWHVVDGTRLPEDGGTHLDHVETAVQHQRLESRAQLLGFYSPYDQGIFTHRGSNTHVHAVVWKPLSAGHVDHVVLPAGVRVRFPDPD